MIVDAIDGSYCQGRPTLILAAIQGLLKSMARGGFPFRISQQDSPPSPNASIGQ